MNATTYEIHKLLILATSHITQEDADLISAEVFPGKGGDEVSLLVYCGNGADRSFLEELADASNYSPAFVQAVELARTLGCRYLLFDNAGPVVEPLPTFDW